MLWSLCWYPHIDTTPTHWGREKIDAMLHTTFFKCIFLYKKLCVWIKISQKFVPMVPVNNIPPFVQIMARRRTGAKSYLNRWWHSWLTHICVTRPYWVKQGKRMDIYKWMIVYQVFWLLYIHGTVSPRSTKDVLNESTKFHICCAVGWTAYNKATALLFSSKYLAPWLDWSSNESHDKRNEC